MRHKVIGLVCILLLAGCSETKEQQQTKQHDIGSIEVVENADAFQQKVAVSKVTSEANQQYYYDYNNDKSVNQDKSYTKMDANLRIRSPYEQVAVELLVNKLSKEFILKCSACHNDYANGIIGPSLLHKDADFIVNTIAQYKTGAKKNVLMHALVKQMDDSQIRLLANEIAAFNKKIAQLRGKEQ